MPIDHVAKATQPAPLTEAERYAAVMAGRQIGNCLADYTRRKLREDGFWKSIMYPTQVPHVDPQ